MVNKQNLKLPFFEKNKDVSSFQVRTFRQGNKKSKNKLERSRVKDKVRQLFIAHYWSETNKCPM